MGMMDRINEDASRNLALLIDERFPQAVDAELSIRHAIREVIRNHSFPPSHHLIELYKTQQTRNLWRKLRKLVTEEALPPLEALIHARAYAREQLEQVRDNDTTNLFQVAINSTRRNAIMKFLAETQPYAFEEVRQEEEEGNK